ncbi:MAG: hypothetical protein APR63_04115 [Desulfuromonas sp. SDB]|nr:MAG: hypothetical protein APR63_04115 [Desulfuromonas sp. SDB]
MDLKLKLSSSPHFRDKNSTRKIMLLVILALIPALIGAIFIYGPDYGFRSGIISLIGVISAMVAEGIAEVMRKRGLTSILDGSAALTGLLLAFNLPPTVPFWVPVVGSFVGIWFGKMVFGGIGFNIFNPALIGRAFLVAAYPTIMTASWAPPAANHITMAGFSPDVLKSNIHTEIQPEKIDAITGATPLTAFKEAKRVLTNPQSNPQQIDYAEATVNSLYSQESLLNLFLGRVGGCIGETSALLLIIGGLFLCFLGIVNWRMPLFYIGTVFILSWILGGAKGFFTGSPLFAIFSGGLMLGAFFMASDMVTSPITNVGQIIFAVGAGILVVVIRAYGGYAEGVSFSILLMNAFTPLIDRYTRPKVFGTKEVKT